MACLLTDTAPLAEHLGRLVRIEFQSGDAYRPLDDILLHLDGAGGPRRCALSVKSNRQFTEAGAPDDFVAAVWRLALEPGETDFRIEHDQAGLMTAPLGGGVADALHAVLRAAAGQDATRSLPTPKGKIQTALLNSFACPAELADRHAPDADKLRRVLRSVVHQEFNFERQNSNSLKHALGVCRSALASGDSGEAELLWGEGLCEFARQLCPNEGVLTRAGLLDRLRKKFALRALPNHEPDWHRLHDATQSEMGTIRDVVGNDLRLPRDGELRKLARDNARWITLHGESGVGKTVVAKWWAQCQPAGVRVWWLNAEALDAVSFSAFQQSLGLRNQLADLLAATPDAAAWLIVDGLDAAYELTVFRNLSQILRSLPACWRVLLACQTEHWERVQHALQQANVGGGWSLVEVLPPTVPEEALALFTNLQPLLQRPKLRSLITRPKYLDSLALRFDPTSYHHEWVGESDLLAWFWQTEVAAALHGSARAEVVKKLGALLGDSLRADVAADEFAVTEHEHQYLDGLIRDRIFRRRHERITVAHDRIGDWARQRVLLGRIDELPQFLADRLDSPLWLLALRLLGIQLLEQDADLERWTRVFEQVGSLSSGERAQDALLEAALFAEQSDVLLEKVWPVLATDRGRLLGRLLTRFAHTGTLPKPIVSQLPAEQAIHLTDVRHRVPIAHHWPALLRVLHAHCDEAIEFAPFSVAQLAGCWLENGPAAGPARRESAALALRLGRVALGWTRQKNFYLEREKGVPFFRAVLLGAAELPDEVAIFARDAAFRLPEQLARRHFVKVTMSLGPGGYSGYYPPPWPNGPAQALHESFQNAALDNATLAPLMRVRPEVAKEVLLAASIAPPQKPDPRLRDNSFLADTLCLDEGSDYSLAHPFRGPFLSLLHVNPEAAIDAIVRLTNFAAERWTTTPRASHAQPREVVVRLGQTERTLLGDYHVFTWYRSGPCPHALTAALMALEFWFTERLLVGTGYEDAAARLLELTNNVAIAGLLCAVGCQKPELFAGVLSPLATVPEFHDWEMARRIAAPFSSPPDENLVRSWDSQPWRRRGLDEIAFELFCTNEVFREFIEPVTARWEERAAAADAPPRFKFLVEQMAPRFRRTNYREMGAGAPLEYIPPIALMERNAERQQQHDVHYLPHQFPFHCRALLEKGAPMPETELDEFWRTLEFIANLDKIHDDEIGVMRKETSYCAAAAVLFILHRAWLRAHPEREQWLVERVTSCILQPPPAALMDDDRDISGYDWSAYAARAVPVLWQESPEEPATRRLVARLATYRKYKTVQYLCGASAARRGDLREHFIELLEFVCDWAVEKQRAERRRFDEEPYDLAPWLEREIEAFVTRSRPRKTVPWKDLAVEIEPPSPWRPNLPRPICYTFDVELWQAAFVWVPRLRGLPDPEEHDWMLSFWRHHLALALQRLNAEPRDKDSRDCLPYGVEQWLLKCVACAVLDLPAPEDRARFWQPIFSTAPHGAHWIEGFAAAILGLAQTDAKSASAFLETWPRMVEWALDAPGWNYSWETSFTLAQAWRTLLGLESAAGFLRVCGDHLVAWKPYFSRWAADWLAERTCAVLFCRFLEEPRANALLVDGLSWLNEKLPAESLRHQRDVSNAVGELLVLLVRTRRETVLGDLRTLQAFRTLLSRLSEIQHQRVVEVETLFADGKGG